MKKMIHFEIRKILDKKMILIIMSFLIINIGNIIFSNCTEISSDFYRGKKQIINQVEGIITQEKVDFLANGLKKNTNLVENGNYDTEKKNENTYTGYVYGDMNAFDEVLTSIQNTYDYHKYINDKISIIDENIDRSHNKNAYSMFLKSRIEGRYIMSFYDSQGIEAYLNYSYTFIFLIILVILGGVNYLYYDRNYDMENMIQITKNGKKNIRRIRYLVMFSFSIIISLIFFISEYICFATLYDINGLFNPIYSLPNYSMSYFNMPILLMIIILIITKILGILCLSSVILLCSQKIKFSYFTIAINFIISLFIWNTLFITNTSPLSIVHLFQNFSVHKILSIYINDIYIIFIGLSLILCCISGLYFIKGKKIYDTI